MHPLRRVAWGFLVVLVDLRFEHFDLIPDVLGCALVIAGLSALADRHVGFRVARLAAWGALVTAVFFEYVFRVPAGASDSGRWVTLDTVLMTVFVFGTCTALRALARKNGDSSTAAGANIVRWLDLALAVVSLAAGVAVGVAVGFPPEPVQVLGEMIVLFLVGVVLTVVDVVWFLVLLFRGGKAGYAVPGPSAPPVMGGG
jgi:hypothetical protein